VALAEDVPEQLPDGAELDALGRWDVHERRVQALRRGAVPAGVPDGSIIRNEFDNVYIQPDVCNGCGYCVPACPYGVITQVPARRSRLQVHPLLRPPDRRPRARVRQGLPDELHPVRRRRGPQRAGEQRVQELHDKGYTQAYVLGDARGRGDRAA
jgi:formate dehydrogenase iron-sulfur subunit